MGLENAKELVRLNHTLIIHGRTPNKVSNVVEQLLAINSDAKLETLITDLSDLSQVSTMINEISERFSKIDVLINNAGVFTAPRARSHIVCRV
ncbi:SDR family NAD(P)-dependent oxidoreductase [Vibrio thalassae]|uniref:SDR family NAD(P)-dependent oxidoreductase n=1 Tax=Vibrio thalassae TaxID=1243014 RepID=UPI002449C329